MFINTLTERWPEERKQARRLGVRPMRLGEPGFAALIAGGRVKWAVTRSNELVFIPKVVRDEEIAHTVLTDGKPVLAAGEAELATDNEHYFLIEITNHSRHYLPDLASLDTGKQAFLNAGIVQL